ncbi:MAG: ABC transporter ATP-binding protein [candidate division NC10 bacterium]|nr:ABC transporter ATP-binding protein [candidate division NC10 bacterium]
MHEIIRLQSLSKVFPGPVVALDRVSLAIPQGEWMAVMGASGSGKSTLLNLLGCLDRPTEGQILMGGTSIGELTEAQLTGFRRETVGLIFQQFHLVPYLSAVENVMLAQYFHSLADEAEASEALARVGLADRLRHRPAQLSGGEQQRVCIARALVNQPKILLADEPTGNLDEANERVVMDIFQQLHDDGHTIVMVTHDPHVGMLADRRIELEHGRLVTIHTHDLVAAAPRTADQS